VSSNQVWGKDKPSPSKAKVMVHPLSYSGEESLDKVEKLRKELQKRGAHALVVAALDEVACTICSRGLLARFADQFMRAGLFNIRGSDIDYNPVVTSYALVTGKHTCRDAPAAISC
jgi:Xaa-Pro aminopeptidase